MTAKFAVIGNPIGHTKSPLIHSRFAASVGKKVDYTAILGEIGQFAPTIDAFRAQGGLGINVTAPFKLDAFAYASVLSERARLAGAVNAMKFDGTQILAENFDGVGLVRDVVHNLDCPLTGKRVLVLGAGGAARGAVWSFIQERPADLVIANRSVDKAVALAAMDSDGVPIRGLGYAELAGEQFDVVFNATSASLYGALPPIPAGVFADGCLAYELAYGKGLTPFLRLAREAGVARLADGVGMLAEQAAEAFAWWHGVRPDTRAVIGELTIPLA